MHLKQLKLAGFKSFVEPTIVPFSSQLIAVVGPNGCGKSNIIDAIRWVMGESSAKNLRGESMVDVIFNGSSTRKSIGQASVELVFDNSMGRLVGPYANYQEIAVKRLLTRDGQSSYYLNGSRCRRRDITDIFLGTGAGARSYSIIGQNTISRLVEAHPDDLRVYLEEAAGISKYKERRKETLQRIQQTRENLSRVADICAELGQQLKRLERQAVAAERYKSLKQESRLYKAEILALKWRDLSNDHNQVSAEINRLILQQEQLRANLTNYKKDEVQFRDKLQCHQDDFQQMQVQFYQLSTDIARLEEMLQQQQREQQQLLIEKEQVVVDMHSLERQLQNNQSLFKTCDGGLKELHLEVSSLQANLQFQQSKVIETEVQKTTWEKQCKTVQTELNTLQRQMQAEELRLQYIGEQLQQRQILLEKNKQEQLNESIDTLRNDLSIHQQHLAIFNQQCEKELLHFQKSVDEGLLIREELTKIEQKVHHSQDIVQKISTEVAALHGMQHALLHNNSHNAEKLEKWEHLPRLAEVIKVSKEWSRACEFVLGDALNAIVLENLDLAIPDLMDLQECSVAFVEPMTSLIAQIPYPRLLDKITGVLPSFPVNLEHIFASDTLENALTWLPHISSHQSIITQDGYWLGVGWVKMNGILPDNDSGILARQQDLLRLNEDLSAAQKALLVLQSSRDEQYSCWVENGREQTLLQKQLASTQEELHHFQSESDKKQLILQQVINRSAALSVEYDEIMVSLEELTLQTMTTQSAHESTTQAVLVKEQKLQEIFTATAHWEDELMVVRNSCDATRTLLHQAEINHQKETSKAQQLQENITREQEQIYKLGERLAYLSNRHQELEMPDDSRILNLQEKLMLHEEFKTNLNSQQLLLDETIQQLSQNEDKTKHLTHEMNDLQENLQKKQLKEQAIAVRTANIVETLTELNADINKVLDTIANDVTVELREQQLKETDEKMQRLGAVNLMAIEEYKIELDRKTHLDAQYNDLTEALVVLDSAIAKMDKETELRLKDTFDQVNKSFQTLFPRLFGGGNAFLELTCDNLLEAGVIVMAQPPGKRNSTIHLLSGGEKAMTAVALVFAIFQLNPSPFCMLDEVDAPLDDLNVQRFCDMVKDMSSIVQFLFITHNKVTMEMADHLIGVTMREPGVSRLVTVDVEQALSLAGG